MFAYWFFAIVVCLLVCILEPGIFVVIVSCFSFRKDRFVFKKKIIRGFGWMNTMKPLASLDSNTVPSTVPSLRPYQLEAARAILDSVFNRKGLTFSIDIALAQLVREHGRMRKPEML
jgi:hypothetical protein